MQPIKAISRFLDTAGDGSGTKNANGDYSSAADDFYFTANKACEIHRIIIEIEDTKGMEPEEYGNLGAALTNGYDLWVKNTAGTKIKDFTDGVPIKTNAGIGRLCYDVDLKSWTNTTNETVLARFTFARLGSPLELKQGESIGVTLNDNLTGLIAHYFLVQGQYV